MSASVIPAGLKPGKMIMPPPDTLYTIVEVSEDGLQLLLEFKYEGMVCRCWCPAREFKEVVKN